MSIFNISDEKMKETFSTFTLTEINQQPATWKKHVHSLLPAKQNFRNFLIR